MSAASNYTEDRTLDYWLKANSAASTSPATVYVALFTTDDSTGGTSDLLEAGTLTNEVTTVATAYVRKAVTFGVITNGSVSNSGNITFDTATANWGTITHIAVMDASTSGNVLFYGSLDTAREILTDDTFQITTGNLTVTLA
jgi:trans-2-enoyl-CoA reductase